MDLGVLRLPRALPGPLKTDEFGENDDTAGPPDIHTSFLVNHLALAFWLLPYREREHGQSSMYE